MALMTLLQAINQTLDSQLKKDPNMVVFGQDVGKLGGVFRVTQGLQTKYGENRVFNTPIAESAIIGSAIGMAMNGLKPVAEIQFDGFIFVGLEDLFAHAARMRNRSRGTRSVPMVVRVPVGGGVKSLEHHSESLEVILGSVPGLKVVIPSNPYDAKGLLMAAIKDPDPVIFMEPKRIYRGFKQEVPEQDYEVEIGKAKIVQEGSDITVVAWGAMVPETQLAIKQINNEVSVELIDLRSINPIDRETVIESVKKTGRFLVVHEACKTYGPAGELITLVNEKAFLHLEAAPSRVTGNDITMPLAKGEHYQFLSPEKIAAAIRKVALEE
ncbi:Pyruvate dehydrogenase E1 comp, beta subunit [Candidatus Phytoplasma australiense]|uniref:Pyruvate dehydrogenase E1 comp, beta subunit n=2 Tax=Phytoplasma australiense TaxID=59748 RepID=B1VAP8_PHYAS|nr:alpha-ketoacid dehydrogenase subunit beta [Candidatus Phytoplasma australiense]AGL90429.1 Pyruvate dehydrogenase E1 component, beta subunit [Strawberry lethal yellows phytoplasma (CPA) str. NZSb11]CAM12021.1 Pyruvate dehydrogenase E1 comp, beta subunit [Candidatus Phytoplasma australiense]